MNKGGVGYLKHTYSMKYNRPRKEIDIEMHLGDISKIAIPARVII